MSSYIPTQVNVFSEAKESIRSYLGSMGEGFGKFNNVNFVTNITVLMYSLFRYYFQTDRERPPAAVLGGIPLGSVDELSHALSSRILKYRATGGVFLAHQGGGEQSLRITAKAFGKNRYQLLTMLDFLFLYGQAQKVDLLQSDLRSAAYIGTYGRQLERESFQDYEEDIARDELPDPTTNPWEEFYEASIDSGMSERHLTFPIVTQNKIYMNMFIETWEYTEAIENGIDVLEINLFLRKYVPEARKEFEIKQDKDEDGNPIGPVEYYYRDMDDRRVKNFLKWDTALDWGLSTAILMYRWYFLSQDDPSVSYGVSQMFTIYSKTEDPNPQWKFPKRRRFKEKLMGIDGE